MDLMEQQHSSKHSSIKNTPDIDHEDHNYYTQRTHDSTSHSKSPGEPSSSYKDMSSQTDTCSDKSCSDTSNTQSLPRTLKILTFNVWNTNVVQGGNKEYVARIKQAAKVSVKTC